MSKEIFLLSIMILCYVNLLTAQSIKSEGETILIKRNKNKTSINPGFNLFKPKTDSSFNFPRIAGHLGISLIFTDGIINLNSDRNPSKDIDFEDDLNFPKYSFAPRVNVVFKVGHKGLFLFDGYAALRSREKLLSNDLYLRESIFPSNSLINSRFHFFNLNLYYRHAFVRKSNFNVGALAGISLNKYRLSVSDAGKKITENVFAIMPVVGLEGIYLLDDKYYFKIIVKYTNLPFEKWNYSQFFIKPQVEYYFSRNFGLGLRYHYSYTKINELKSKSFNGPFHFHVHMISLFGCLRIY